MSALIITVIIWNNKQHSVIANSISLLIVTMPTVDGHFRL